MCTWYKGITKETLPQHGGSYKCLCCQSLCPYHSKIDEEFAFLMVVPFRATSNSGDPYLIQKASQ